MPQPTPSAKPNPSIKATQKPSAAVVDSSSSPNAQLRPVPLGSVTLTDNFWSPRRRINKDVTLPTQFQHLEDTYRLNNFRRAAGKLDAEFVGLYFNDSDVYKWLEAAAWTLAEEPTGELEDMVNTVIGVIEAAQHPDGYVNSYFSCERADERWTNFDMHELYCAGHLFQAAVAHVRATGETTLLDVATRFADHICDTFGSDEGKLEAVGGHEEVKLALVELYRVTHQKRYLEQAEYFIEARGRGLLGEPYGRFESDYAQDHQPVRELDEMVGHAVRALYYTNGITDVYMETGDADYLKTLERLWENMTQKRMYVSGGLGARYVDEGFGTDYELPNERAYAETCAAIASVMWNWRLLALDGDVRYADLLEWTLYNAVLPGLSLNGQEYFYQNPLADDGKHRRQAWFGCACCPPNVARMLASLPGYFCSTQKDELWLHLYAEGKIETTLENGQELILDVNTRYPWDGAITLNIQTSGTYSLNLRIPAWAEGATLSVNDEAVTELSAGGYATLKRTWTAGATVQLHLPMPIRFIEAHPHVTENAGRIALARGPLLYCAEGLDQDIDPRNLIVPELEAFTAAESDELGGVILLHAQALAFAPKANYLYRTVQADTDQQTTATKLIAIPYYAWANRDPSPMQVWLRR